MDFEITHGDTWTYPVNFQAQTPDGQPMDASGVYLRLRVKFALASPETLVERIAAGKSDGSFPPLVLGSTTDFALASYRYELVYTRTGFEKTILTGKLKFVTRAVKTKTTDTSITFTENTTPIQLVSLPEAIAASNAAAVATAAEKAASGSEGRIASIETSLTTKHDTVVSAHQQVQQSKARVVDAESEVNTKAQQVAVDRTAVEAAKTKVVSDSAQVAKQTKEVSGDRAVVQTLVDTLKGDLTTAAEDVKTSSAYGTAHITTIAGAEQLRLFNITAGHIADMAAAGDAVQDKITEQEKQSLQSVSTRRDVSLADIDRHSAGHKDAIDAKKEEALNTQTSHFTQHLAEMGSRKDSLSQDMGTQAQGYLDSMGKHLNSVTDAKAVVISAQTDVGDKHTQVNTALLNADRARDDAIHARDEVVADSGSTTNAMMSMATQVTRILTSLVKISGKINE